MHTIALKKQKHTGMSTFSIFIDEISEFCVLEEPKYILFYTLSFFFGPNPD